MSKVLGIFSWFKMYNKNVYLCFVIIIKVKGNDKVLLLHYWYLNFLSRIMSK